MIETIDTKYLKQRRENGDVYIRWGTWVDKHEKRVVKESVPVIGKIFPFIKRKKTVDVVVGMEGPFINETDVSKFDFSNLPKDVINKDKGKEIRRELDEIRTNFIGINSKIIEHFEKEEKSRKNKEQAR